MKTVLAVTFAFFCLCAASTFAAPVKPAPPAPATQTYECKELADNARDHLIRVKIGVARAEVENYWGDSRRDQGELKANKSNGDRIFKGFPHWVADGVEGSGYLYVSKKLIKSGKGQVMLFARLCKDGCSDRRAKLECHTEAVGPQKP